MRNNFHKILTSTLFFFFTVTLLIAQPREINKIISEKASSKMHYQLVLSTIHYKDYKNNMLKSSHAKGEFQRALKSMSQTIEIDTDAIEPTVDILIKVAKGTILDKKLFLNYYPIEGPNYFFVAGRVRIKDLETLGNLEGIIRMEPSYKLEPELNQTVKDINADKVWIGGSSLHPVDNYITGKGVLVGLIDTKPNFRHFTFLNDKGQSRFIEQYDLSAPDDHGSHVAGIMAGRGIWNNEINSFVNRGVAYESDIIWREGPDVTSAIIQFNEMIDFSGDSPLVVNLSKGWKYGPRDGSTIFEESLDSLIKGNKILIKSAGNESNISGINNHLKGKVPSTEGDFYEFDFKINDLIKNCTSIEIWHNSEFDFQIGYPDQNTDLRWSEIVKFGELDNRINIDQISDDFITIVNSNSDDNPESLPNSLRSKVIYIGFESSDTNFQSGTYRIRLYAHNGIGGSFDAYHNNSNQIGGIINGDNYQTITIPGYAKNVITVAAHRKNDDERGDWAPYSSLGPSRIDEGNISKPDISAPGGWNKRGDINEVYSAHYAVLYEWVHMQGTSMAAPHVSGAIALLMQCFPQITAIQVKEILQKSAGPIPTPEGGLKKVTEAEDRKYWGAGKLDILV